jgi:5-methylcytosine-specific restriction endonuclease McrA
MRPINHPAQPAANVYPTFRLDTLAHLRADLEAYDWNTTSDVPEDYFGYADLDGWDALKRTLLKLIVDPPKKRKRDEVTLQDVAHYASLFRDRTYRMSNTPLCNALGRYCSYCEQILTEMIAVEHVAPKAKYPLTSVCWENFLLCCRACNSTKDEKPPRSVPWMAGAGDEVDRYDEIRDHYLWPDTDTDAYRAMKPVLCWSTGGAYQPVPDAVSVSDALARVSKGNSATKTPRAQIPFATGNVTANVLACLIPTAPAAAAAQETVTGFGLAKAGLTSTDDNRMWDRTNRWLEAVNAFRRLDATNDFDSVWESLCEFAGSTGFLTTWVRVLQLRGGAVAPYPAPPAMATSTLLAQFLQEMTQGADAPYPNTDVNLLP